jgi:FkbM family methyltransferase
MSRVETKVVQQQEQQPAEQKRRLVFDIGANHGEWTAANWNRFDTFVMVDANPAMCASLEKRYAAYLYDDKIVAAAKDDASKFKKSCPEYDAAAAEADPVVFEPRVHVLNRLVTDSKQVVPFYVCSSDGLSTASQGWIKESRFASYKNLSWQPTKTPLSNISIDQMVATFGVPDLIKIDVEGYELSVVRSLTKSRKDLGGCPIAFEWAEESRDDMIKIVAHLSKLGYSKFHAQDKDAYTYVPEASKYLTEKAFVEWMSTSLKPERKSLWGMIHVC